MQRKQWCIYLYASNFSLGVNLFFELNKKLATMMANILTMMFPLKKYITPKKLIKQWHSDYTLPKSIARSKMAFERRSGEGIPISAIRKDDVPGTHTVTHHSEIDEISITHTAHNRHGFALGAVVAAEWILGKRVSLTCKTCCNCNICFSINSFNYDIRTMASFYSLHSRCSLLEHGSCISEQDSKLGKQPYRFIMH